MNDGFKATKEKLNILGVEVSAVEMSMIENVQGYYNKFRVIFGHRFIIWCKYNKLNPTGLLKVKLKQSYMAGCFSALDSNTRNVIDNESL